LKLLWSTPTKFGTEIDIRAQGSELILNHDPFYPGESLINYLDEYSHGTLVLNIKETGIETEVLRLVRQRNKIKNYFLLDVEFPYIYKASRRGEKAIAMRFSEDESIETIKKYIGKVDWVWIDTNTMLPINRKNISILNKFKKCLVCPEMWNRPTDIELYKLNLKKFNFIVDSVMTSRKYINTWSI
tara:strand:- start:610 stop:1167 length:558 start_codon:yes stop_codon:yes gene_type:complete